MKKESKFLKILFMVVLPLIFVVCLFGLFITPCLKSENTINISQVVEIEKHERQNIKKANTTNNETVSFYYNVQGDFLVFSSDVGNCYVRAFDSMFTYNLIGNKLFNGSIDFAFDVLLDSLVQGQEVTDSLYFNFNIPTEWGLISNFDYNFTFYYDENLSHQKLQFGISLRLYNLEGTRYNLSDSKTTNIDIDHITSYQDNFNTFTFDLTEILENFNTLYQNGYSKGFTTGQQVQKDLYNQNDTALNKIWTILENGIKTALNVLSIEILPGIPLTICVIVPLIFGIIFFIWKGGAQ